jgi:signal transduction histidine kinase
VNRLLARIVVLTALVALGTGAAAAWVAGNAAVQGFAAQEDRQARRDVEVLRGNLAMVCSGLAYEVGDYANWDELYRQMPQPETAWAAINLRPGREPGALVRAMACVAGGAVHGRYRDDSHRLDQPEERDPAPAAALALLGAAEAPIAGATALAGHPALFASAPVLHSDRSGPPRGWLIGLAYCDAALCARLAPPGCELEVRSGALDAIPPAPGAPPALAIADLVRVDGRLEARVEQRVHDGTLVWTLRCAPRAGQDITARTVHAIANAGLASSLAALLAGSLLGWYWLRPLARLTAACRARARDPGHPLPDDLPPGEAALLAGHFAELIGHEQRAREELAATLDRESTANAMHQRFLAQLGHELGGPMRALCAVVDSAAAQGGRLDPEQLVAAQGLALTLEERFQEVLGMAEDVGLPSGRAPVRLDQYLARIAELLRPVAQRRDLRLEASAPPERAPVDARLLTPALINLAANALKAGHVRAVGLAVALAADGSTCWTVADDGSGLEPGLAERVRAACARGEVLPGEPGFGLGLALVLANARALGGRLELARNGPDGATFALHLPRRG